MVQSKKLLQFDFIEHYFLDKKESVSGEKYHDALTSSITVEQVHGNNILWVRKKEEDTHNFDGMMTQKNFWLKIRTADCLPIFFLDPYQKIIAGVHAGWKGLSLRIIKKCIAQMKKIGSNPHRIIACIGPHIGVCCYNVQYERIEKFMKKLQLRRKDIAEYRNRKWYLDLSNIAQKQMINEGISRVHIDLLSICTFCNTAYSSSRREGSDCQRMISMIRIIN